MIKPGDGSNKVSWTVNLPETGSYDIYFYNETSGTVLRPGRGLRGQGGRNKKPSQGEKHFIVHNEEENEEIAFDVTESPQGWILLGTFRLASGMNRVEQTDKSKGVFLTADAVKWVKSKQN